MKKLTLPIVGFALGLVGGAAGCDGCGNDSAGQGNQNNNNSNGNNNQTTDFEVMRGESCIRQYTTLTHYNASLCNEEGEELDSVVEQSADATLIAGGLNYNVWMSDYPHSVDGGSVAVPTEIDVLHYDGQTLLDATSLDMMLDQPVDLARFTPDPLMGPQEGKYAIVATNLRQLEPETYREDFSEMTEECGEVSGYVVVDDVTECVDYALLKFD
ncbi:TPA: hypothetical protein HA265_00915 [Candidatus Woesearchaeota archaeon]|nr:hypothetical protein [Candidatus Woesearchaeota archaeon]